MGNIAKIERVAGLYRIRILPVNVRRPLVVTAQPTYQLAQRHIRCRFPGFHIVDAKTFDREAQRRMSEARREREQAQAKKGLHV
jgi:hypothetical protein